MDRFVALKAWDSRTMPEKAIATEVNAAGGSLVSRRTDKLYAGDLVDIVFMPGIRQYVSHLHRVTDVFGINGAESS